MLVSMPGDRLLEVRSPESPWRASSELEIVAPAVDTQDAFEPPEAPVVGAVEPPVVVPPPVVVEPPESPVIPAVCCPIFERTDERPSTALSMEPFTVLEDPDGVGVPDVPVVGGVEPPVVVPPPEVPPPEVVEVVLVPEV